MDANNTWETRHSHYSSDDRLYSNWSDLEPETKKVLYKESNRTHSKKQREGTCICPKEELGKCTGNCEYCPHNVSKDIVDTDTMDEHGFTALDKAADKSALTEDDIIEKIQAEKLRELIELLPYKERMIILGILAEEKQSKTQKALGMERGAYRWERKIAEDHLRLLCIEAGLIP